MPEKVIDNLSISRTYDNKFQKARANLLFENKRKNKNAETQFVSKSKCETESESPEFLKKKQFFSECGQKAYNLWQEKSENNDLKENEPIFICEMSLDDFLLYSPWLPRCSYFDDGKVYLKKMPTYMIHEVLVADTTVFFSNLFKRMLICGGQMTCPIGKRKTKEADVSYAPVDRNSRMVATNENDYPTLVFEMSNLNEDYEELYEELMEWIGEGTTVQIAIGIKIGHHDEGYSLTMLIAMRGEPEPRVFQIGEVDLECKPVDRSRLPILPLPVALLFDSAPIPETLSGISCIGLDLPKYSEELIQGMAYVNRIGRHFRR